MGLVLGIGIRDYDWGLRSGIRIRDGIGNLDWGLETGIGDHD